jgi:hypothetical protein
MSITYQVVYWRDIPAQIKLRSEKGRLARSLSPRFQEAIDAAAMRANATGTDDYLEEWRTGPPQQGEGDPEGVADIVAAELEAAYPPEKLDNLVVNKGYEKT